MLEKILNIQGVGLFHEASGAKFACKKATLIYGDNARGKTTLTNILRSVASNDVLSIINQKTVDGMNEPKIKLIFSNGRPVNFENSKWSENRQEVLVFNADFIERNVHSGATINTEQRKNLLEFALGESAVTARQELEKLTSDSKIVADELQNLTAQISGYHSDMSLATFKHLPILEKIDDKISELNKKIVEANNVLLIVSKPMPALLVVPIFDIENIFVKLAFSLEGMHDNAERIVKEHIAKLGHNDAENWLSQGQHFSQSKDCLYCGQTPSSNDLILAYRDYFNAEYINLKTQIDVLQNEITEKTNENFLHNMSEKITAVRGYITGWSEHVEISPVEFDEEAIRTAMSDLKIILLQLTRKKQESPAESIDTAAAKLQSEQLWSTIVIAIQDINLMIKAAIDAINLYKSSLENADIQQLKKELDICQKTKCRYQDEVAKIISEMTNLEASLKDINKKKEKARDNLNSIMQSTLEAYETSINHLLSKFGASFRIKKMGANHRGASPRSEYGLELRGKLISLEGQSPPFSTALSDGDKRTLAFSFFIASTLSDPKLAQRIVVIDDPMCSLDRTRKQHTKEVLKNIYSKSTQLIVLAHDPYFIRDVCDFLKKSEKDAQINVFQLAYALNNYTDFAAIDINEECESDYYKHHRLIREFIDGKNNANNLIAKSIRPMLEGYLHRRFPCLISTGLVFGQIVQCIQSAGSTDPLWHAKNLVEELNEINNYAGQFHHDTNASADSMTTDSAELLSYARRALQLIYKSSV